MSVLLASLLDQLRNSDRLHPAGLHAVDDSTVGELILTHIRQTLPASATAVYTVETENVWTLLARDGSDEQVSALPGPPFARAETGQIAVVDVESRGTRLGVLVCQRQTGSWQPNELSNLNDLASDFADGLSVIRILAQVQSAATMAERHRLAREIHDGIAQEVASMGYLVDDLVASSDSAALTEQLTNLRGELSRIVTELRLSIFDLRNEVGADRGLAGALSEYVRRVGAHDDLTIHLVLSESAQRLPEAVEFELLRIAQEAITNVRRHAKARNLWITCRIDPPAAYLRVADDGIGRSGDRSPDSHGLAIMAERASNAGVNLTVRGRQGGGTVIEINTDSPGAREPGEFMQG